MGKSPPLTLELLCFSLLSDRRDSWISNKDGRLSDMKAVLGKLRAIFAAILISGSNKRNNKCE